MKNGRRSRFGGITLPTDRAASSENRPIGSIRAMASAMDALMLAPGAQLIPWLAVHASGLSVAPKLLEFATGGTANCCGGRSCARLYLTLQGMAIPIGDTTTGMDLERREWWVRAVVEHLTGQWGGDTSGVKAIAAAQPLIWKQAEAATRAWEGMQQEPRDQAGSSPLTDGRSASNEYDCQR